MSSLNSSCPTRTDDPRAPSPIQTKMTFRQFMTSRFMGALGLAGGAVLLASSLPVLLGGAAGPQTASEAPSLEVRVRGVRPVEGYRTRSSFTGEVRAARHVELGFDLGGRILEVLVDEGDRVDMGDILARLDIRRLESRRAELRAKKAAADALLAELEAGPRSEVIESAASEVTRLESELELAEQIQQRRTDLRVHDAVSTEELESAQTRVHALRASLAGAKSRLAELRTGTRDEQKLAQGAVVAEIESALLSLGVDVADAKLRAPFGGRIAERRLHEGAIVGPGESVLRLVESGALEVWVGVTDAVRRELEIGATLDIDIEGSPRQAKVRTVLPTLDPTTRSWTVVLELVTTADLVPGQIARLSIPRVVEESGVWVPTDALVQGVRGLWSCYLVVPQDESPEGSDIHLVHRADVEVLHTEGARTLVRGDLGAGDRMIVAGVHRVVPGQHVVPVDER